MLTSAATAPQTPVHAYGLIFQDPSSSTADPDNTPDSPIELDIFPEEKEYVREWIFPAGHESAFYDASENICVEYGMSLYDSICQSWNAAYGISSTVELWDGISLPVQNIDLSGVDFSTPGSYTVPVTFDVDPSVKDHYYLSDANKKREITLHIVNDSFTLYHLKDMINGYAVLGWYGEEVENGTLYCAVSNAPFSADDRESAAYEAVDTTLYSIDTANGCPYLEVDTDHMEEGKYYTMYLNADGKNSNYFQLCKKDGKVPFQSWEGNRDGGDTIESGSSSASTDGSEDRADSATNTDNADKPGTSDKTDNSSGDTSDIDNANKPGTSDKIDNSAGDTSDADKTGTSDRTDSSAGDASDTDKTGTSGKTDDSASDASSDAVTSSSNGATVSASSGKKSGLRIKINEVSENSISFDVLDSSGHTKSSVSGMKVYLPYDSDTADVKLSVTDENKKKVADASYDPARKTASFTVDQPGTYTITDDTQSAGAGTGSSDLSVTESADEDSSHMFSISSGTLRIILPCVASGIILVILAVLIRIRKRSRS